MPMGDGDTDLVTVFEKRDEKLVNLRVVCPARFVPLLGVNGFELS